MIPIRIAQVATSDMSIRFLLLDQIKALQSMGHQVTAVCAPGPWVKTIRSQGVPVETINISRELNPIRDLKSLVTLYQYFRKHRFDVVHTHTPKAGLLAPFAAKLARVPIVLHTIHGLLFHNRMPLWKQILFWFPEKFTALFSDYLMSQSQEDIVKATKTRLCSARKLFYLGNGIDLKQFSPKTGFTRSTMLCRKIGLSEKDFVVGCVGRLVYEKGFTELFVAAEEISSKYEHVKFIIIGPMESDQNDAVSHTHIQLLKEKKAVIFLGWQDNMTDWYSIMDTFILPSHREGVPRACMEASAMKLPVVATDIRGCREVVRHGETGLLVPVKDAKALSKAIEHFVLRDKSLKPNMGTNGREHIMENFNDQLVIQRLILFYQRMESILALREAGIGRRN